MHLIFKGYSHFLRSRLPPKSQHTGASKETDHLTLPGCPSPF